MSSSRGQRLEQLFFAAQSLTDEERSAFLRRECVEDQSLATEVEALLAAASRSEAYFEELSARIGVRAFLSAPQARVETADFVAEAEHAKPTDELAGTVVGAYRLIREIGVGGMGSVWLAERTDGLIKRPLALKLPHIASRRVGLAERMAREREILATLTHPNIARLYDAGVTTEGRPFLALEYVEGEPIDVYCSKHQLDLHERLRLFLQVANAVAYAHAKLIIHRDLKPENILVKSDGEVRLLDFGVAKLLDETQANATQLTEVSGRALTPDYASPEQILGEPLTIATDVYSLGVVLYELCAGVRPYKLNRGSRRAMEDAIVQVDPPRPSEVGEVHWRKQLRGDIDTIVLCSLKKDPRERYPTANALVDDVIRYLERRPVLARPDSALYRARKFVQRNRVAVIGAGVVALTMVAATAVSLRYAHVTSEHARRIAVERERADSIKLFLVDMLKSADPNLAPSADTTVKDVVQDKFSNIKSSFNDDPETKIELLRVFAEVFEVLRLMEQQKEALNMQLALLGQGAPSAEYAKVLADRARAEEKLGDYETAFKSVGEALEINIALNLPRGMAENFHQLGLLHHLKGEYDKAAPLYEQALGIRRSEYGENSLEYADTLYELGVLYDDLGRHEEAELNIRRVLGTRENALGPLHTEVAEALTALGTTLSRQKKLDEAIVANTKALAVYGALFGPDNRYAHLVVNNIGHDYRRKGDLARAKLEFEKALSLTRKFYPGHPDEGIILANIGDVAYAMDEHAMALDSYRDSLPIFEAHMPEHAKILQMRLRIGLCLAKLRRFSEGEKYFEPAFVAIDANDIFTDAMVQDAAREIIDVYSAWGRNEKIPFYQSFLDKSD